MTSATTAAAGYLAEREAERHRRPPCSATRRASELIHGFQCYNPVRCELPSNHGKAHHGRDPLGREWVWWTYGNGSWITRLCDHPILDDDARRADRVAVRAEGAARRRRERRIEAGFG